MKTYFVLILGGLCVFSGCGGGPSGPPPQPPNLHLSPASLSFGVWVVGTESAVQVETLTNKGGSDLVINSVAITGTDAADFNQSSTCASSLGAGASCAINVTFTPSQLGQRSASMTISDDGVDGPQILSLNGDGGDAGANATLSAPNLTFGSQTVNTTSPPQSITLNNYGTTTLNVTTITTTTDFGETDDCRPSLASGTSCTINVTFVPSTTGGIDGTLSATDNAAGSPQNVALSGTGSSGGGMCVKKGGQCYQGHSCCPGLTCIPASTRAFCE